MRATSVAGAVLAAALMVSASAAAPDDPRERFKQLARRYVERDGDAGVVSELFALIDAEVIDSLKSGGPFASAAFIRERLDGFTAEWGGLALEVVEPASLPRDRLLLVLGTVMRGEPRGWLRVYSGEPERAATLTTVVHDGTPEFHGWPNGRDGARQFLVSWRGTPTGRGSRPMYLELWRHPARGGVTRVWQSDEAFPEGVAVTDFAVKGARIRIRYETRYPGWTPGCEGETEQEDTYHQPSGGDRLVLQDRRVLHAWHRELHAVVTRFFTALGAGDQKTLASLVRDASVRARVPATLRLEAACDQLAGDGSGAVVVAATDARHDRLTPWSLTWRREPRGWRLTAATPVLE